MPNKAETLADAVLKAAGSALRHYTHPETKAEIIAAAQTGLDVQRAQLCNTALPILKADRNALLECNIIGNDLSTLEPDCAEQIAAYDKAIAALEGAPEVKP